MKRNMFILLFLTVVPCMQSLTRKYELIMEWKTWPEAQAYCRDTYTDLAAMEGWDDLANFNTEAQTQAFHSCAWIGVYTNTSDWHWSLGNELLGPITYWYSVVHYQEPNNANGIEDCCAFNILGWFDRTCTELFAFMCFDDRNTGTDKYIYNSTLLSWSDAQSYCRLYHTDLPSSRDMNEQRILMSKIPQTSDFTWFGLFRKGWMWSDGSNSNFINWAINSAVGNNDCVYVCDGKPTNTNCSKVYPFFCESVLYPRVQQILKVKVQSNQDMNDATVMLAILEKIQQKMNDHGMTKNITLKWRTESDGLVWHKENDDYSALGV